MDPLLEYATGASPAVADAGRLPVVTVSGSGVRLSYSHALTADDVAAVVVQSSDLSQWTPASVAPVSAVPAANGTQQITVRLTDPPAGRFFLKVRWQLRL
jgi:hypothetical protein